MLISVRQFLSDVQSARNRVHIAFKSASRGTCGDDVLDSRRWLEHGNKTCASALFYLSCPLDFTGCIFVVRHSSLVCLARRVSKTSFWLRLVRQFAASSTCVY